jgi:hypothetical protein
MWKLAGLRAAGRFGLDRYRMGLRACVRTRKAEIRAEKFGSGQERQGLKPDIFSIVYGPTKVVP